MEPTFLAALFNIRESDSQALREEFAYWLTTELDFCFVRAEKLRSATAEELPVMPTLQELRRRHDGWVVTKRISYAGVIAGDYATEYLSLSCMRSRGKQPFRHH